MLAITACVLAIAVPLVVAAALITYVQSALTRQAATLSASFSQSAGTWTNSFAQLQERVTTLDRTVRETSNAHLATEVAALAGDLEAHAASCRKQFGKLFADLHHAGVQRSAREQQTDFVDDELAAMLALQKAGGGSPRPNGADQGG